MVRSSSLFNQLLQQVPREVFAKCVDAHGGDFGAKGFTCWTQFVSMLFCQLGRAESLREICHGLGSAMGKLNHLGLAQAPNKSSLSYANRVRPAALYEDLFFKLLQRFREQKMLGGHKKFRFKNKLLSFDSTTVSLCLALFPWAEFRRAKGGVKIHLALDHDDYMPAFVAISEARQHDVKMARALRLTPGSIVAVDKGYIDYRLFAQWTERGVYFVTRMKDNAQYHVTSEKALPERRKILRDEIIELTGASYDACPHPLRRVAVWDEENSREIVLLTNHLDFGPTTIAAIYKERWQIELFFKSLKQNLKIKTFIGTSENALRIQIWTALIALLLLKWLHHLSSYHWSLSNLACLLRLNLFTHRNLEAWLNQPMNTPPLEPLPEQLPLFGQQALNQATGNPKV